MELGKKGKSRWTSKDKPSFWRKCPLSKVHGWKTDCTIAIRATWCLHYQVRLPFDLSNTQVLVPMVYAARFEVPASCLDVLLYRCNVCKTSKKIQWGLLKETPPCWNGPSSLEDYKPSFVCLGWSKETKQHVEVLVDSILSKTWRGFSSSKVRCFINPVEYGTGKNALEEVDVKG